MKTRLIVLLALTAMAGVMLAEPHPHNAKGFDPKGVFHFNELDTINAFNGNLTVQIPIGQPYPLGGGLTFQLRLHSNGKVWDAEEREEFGGTGVNCGKKGAPDCVSAYPDRRANAGLGWTMSLGRLYPPFEQTNTSSSWEYESPDGAVYRFYDTLHPGDPVDGAKYTRDGTYLRMTVSGNQRLVEFPTGEVHTFVPNDDPSTADDADNAELAPWVLRHIGTRYNLDALTVTYAWTGGAISTWTIEDEASSRRHTVDLARFAFESGTEDVPLTAPFWGTAQERMLVTRVTLATFNQTTGQYVFHYAGTSIGRPNWHSVSGSYQVPAAPVQLLSSLELPDGSAFSFAYETENNILAGHGGCLKEMTLPTRGRIAWTWGTYDLPTREEGLDKSSYGGDRLPGVIARTVRDHDDTLVGTWTYAVTREAPGSTFPFPTRHVITTITDPTGAKVENYFNVSSWDAASAEYGLPYTPLLKDQSGTRFLSQRFFPSDGGALPFRSTYVVYELDSGTATHRNSRVVSSRTLAHVDNRTTDTENLKYDGYGHFRTVKTIIDGAASSARTTETAYRRGIGADPSAPSTFVRIGVTEPWVTGTYDSITTSDSTSTTKSEYCFDTNGGLIGQRTLRGAAESRADLLTVITRNADGDVTRERFYGGGPTDTATSHPSHLPSSYTGACVTSALNGALLAYELSHTYSSGARASTAYSGVSFKSADLTVDATGLVQQSRDSAGVVTAFHYDSGGRLSEVRPSGTAWTHYQYVPATAAQRASVSVTQWPENAAFGGGTPLTRQVYHYDGLGRLVQQARLMPAGWSVLSIRYDALNRVVAEYPAVYTTFSGSVPQYVATPAGTPAATVYDGEGRVSAVTRPDQSRTDFLFQLGEEPSSRGKQTKTKVATVAGADPLPGDVPTHVVVQEELDGFGRLVAVTEDATGAALVTAYSYDAGNRLRTVSMGVQTRTFEYDGAGLLNAEKHPEQARITYTYDARGHMLSRAAAGTTLTYEYDKAERLTAVKEGTNKLKAFFFDRANNLPALDRSMGKLDRAVRYNRHPNLPGQLAIVEERFLYRGPGGAVSSKETTVLMGVEGAIPDESYRFADHYEYDQLGSVASIEYPACTAGCPAFNAPPRTVTSQRQLGLLSAVNDYAGAFEYGPTGAVTKIVHLNSDPNTAGPVYERSVDSMGRPTNIRVSRFCDDLREIDVDVTPDDGVARRDEPVTLAATARNAAGAVVTSGIVWQWYRRDANGDHLVSGQTGSTLVVPAGDPAVYFARATSTPCSVDGPLVTVKACDTAVAAIAAPDTVRAGVRYTATVNETPGATYQWSATNADIVSAGGVTVDFIPHCSGTVVLTVTATTSCGTSSRPKNMTIAPARAFVLGTRTVPQGGWYELTVDLEGEGPWLVKWADLPNAEWHSQSPATRSVNVTQTTTYSVSSVTSAGCALEVVGDAKITLAPACDALNPQINFSPASTLASRITSAKSSLTGPGYRYRWSVSNGAPVTSTDTDSVFKFLPGCTGNVRLTLTVTDACGASATVTKDIPIDPPTVTIQPASERLVYIPGGDPAVISYDLVAVAPVITWSDGRSEEHQVNVNTSRERAVMPSATTTYSFTSVQDHFGCTGDGIGQSTVSVCPRPPATITAPASMPAFSTATASVPATPGATYAWSILTDTGEILSGATTPTVVFRASCSRPVRLIVTVTPGASGCASVLGVSEKDIPVTPPSATLSGSTTITQGSSATLHVALTGEGPWSVTWEDLGVVSVTREQLPYKRIVTPNGTQTYRLTSMSHSGGCSGTVSGEAEVKVLLPTPSSVTAQATGPNTVRVQWTYAGVAERFRVYRRDGSLAGSPTSAFFEEAVPAGTAQTYRVVAVNGASTSAFSAPDVATAVMFSAEPLPIGGEPRTADVVELRAAVNAMRVLAGLGQVSFTDPDLSIVDIKAVHLIELRTALAAARSALGLLPAGYSRTPVAGDEIFASDVVEIRMGVK